MLIDELGDVVDAVVDDDVHSLVGIVVRGYVGRGECLGHFYSFICISSLFAIPLFLFLFWFGSLVRG